ncbi:enoyl-CoA hydratase [soil metagenome]
MAAHPHSNTLSDDDADDAGPVRGDNAPMAGLLSLERHEDVAVVTLQRPEKRNALSIDLRVEIAESFGALGEDTEVGAIVLTGAPPAFCSGIDTTQFGGDRPHRERLVQTSVDCFSAVARCPHPVVAAVNGPALAGGFALALFSDLRIASEDASFGFPERPQGIPPSYAAARMALPTAVATELVLTGRTMDAFGALKLGIVSAVHSADELMPRALELAGRIASGPRSAVTETKRRILADRESTFGHLFDAEEEALRAALLGDDEPDGAA